MLKWAIRTQPVRALNLLAFLAVAIGIGTATGAHAASFTGTLSFLVGVLPPTDVSGSGSGISSASLVTVSSSAFSGTAVANPTSGPITQLAVQAANGSGAFSGATLSGVMPLIGTATFQSTGGTFAVLQLTAAGTRGAGIGGTVTAPTPSGTLQLVGAPWTTGVAAITGVTTAGGFTLTFSVSGFDSRTASGDGTLQLVTPMRISSGTLGVVPVFAVMNLAFVPEPASGLLLVGTAGMLLAGRRRANR